MTTVELLLQTFDEEMKGTRKILERVPFEKADYQPHGKSFTLGGLAEHVAQLPGFGYAILTESVYDVANPPGPKVEHAFKSTEDLLTVLDEGSAKLRSALAGASAEDLEQEWKLIYGEHVISQASRAISYLLMFFNHMVHHRAQLGVYLRLLNVPVPGLYGPSADEPFGSQA